MIVDGLHNFCPLLFVVKIDTRRSHDYLRSCPSSSGEGRLTGPRNGNRLAKPRLDGKVGGAVKTNDYKLWFSGSRVARNGVGIIIGPPYYENVVDVCRRSDRIMSVRLVIQEVTHTVISAYAPFAGLGEAEKRHFLESLDEVVRMCPMDHRLIIGGDLNGHIGTDVEGYAGVHGGFGYGVRNEEGLSILEFAVAHDLIVANSFFKKTNAQLATFHSGGHSTQIDYLLIRKGDLRNCGDCKVLTDLTCSSQHRLLAMDLVLQRRVTKRVRSPQPKIRWKKLNGEKAETFKTLVLERVDAGVELVSHEDANHMWNCLASTIREVAKEVLGVSVGTSRGHRSDRESWWLSDEVQSKVALKQQRFRELITCREGDPMDRTRAEEGYKEAKREAKKAVARAKDKAYEVLYRRLDSKEGANDIYRIAKAWERRRRDLDNIKPEHHEDLQDSDIEQPQNNMDCGRINQEEVRSALRKMGRNKAVGPDQIPIEAWRCLGDDGVRWLTVDLPFQHDVSKR
ncbi:uncharacterized protein [Rutidosis leptorrhynchoides]|uniref:uncharacterized protein n=1 Tax=Rutidosis leptorrhynchoides TaxID=125765 RepID=UPI003A999513